MNGVQRQLTVQLLRAQTCINTCLFRPLSSPGTGRLVFGAGYPRLFVFTVKVFISGLIDNQAELVKASNYRTVDNGRVRLLRIATEGCVRGRST